MKKPFLFIITWCALILMSTATVSAQDTVEVVYQIFQNNEYMGNVQPIATNQTAKEYYNYTNPSGSPGFGTEARKSFIWLHENATNGNISMGFIHNKHDAGGNSNSVHMEISGLPDTASLDENDDPNDDYTLDPPTATFRWGFQNRTDGAVIGGLNELWQIEISITEQNGISNWAFVTGADGLGRIELDLASPLIVKAINKTHTLHYWRFEQASNLGRDYAESEERADLVTNGQVNFVELTDSDFPSFFSTSPGGTNRFAADFSGGVLTNDSVVPIVDSFTAEAFIHMRTAVDPYGDVIVAMGDQFGGHYSVCSWALTVRYDQLQGTLPNEFTLTLYEGNAREIIGSGFVLEVNTDYYIAAAVDMASGQITFWMQNLTQGEVLQRSVQMHNRTELNVSSRLSIGDDGTEVSGFTFDGLIDEVRISDEVLSEENLLVNNTTPVECLEVPANYVVSIEPDNIQDNTLLLINRCDAPLMVNLEIDNPYTTPSVSLVDQDFVSIQPQSNVAIVLQTDATSADPGTYDEIRLNITLEDGQTYVSNITVHVTDNPTVECLEATANYGISIEPGNRQDNTLLLSNRCNTPLRMNLEIDNPYTTPSVSLVDQDPVLISAYANETIVLQTDAESADPGMYDGILLNITLENGQTFVSNITVHVTPNPELPDLTIGSDDIAFDPDSMTIRATVHNIGNSTAERILVHFYEFGELIETEESIEIDEIPAEGTGIATINLPIDDPAGERLIRVIVDPESSNDESLEIDELSETNNEANKVIQWGDIIPLEGCIAVSGSLPSAVYSGADLTLSGQAVYDLAIDGVPNTDYEVKGGTVQAVQIVFFLDEDGNVLYDEGNEWIYGGMHTDIHGDFSKRLKAPKAIGNYRMFITVSDKTCTGHQELDFKVVEKPPTPQVPPDPPRPTRDTPPGDWVCDPEIQRCLWEPPDYEQGDPIPDYSDLQVFSENVHFSDPDPDAYEEITAFAEILYWTNDTDNVAEDIPVDIWVTYPGTQPVQIGLTVIPSLSVGGPDFGSRYVYASWQNWGDGIYIVEVKIDTEKMDSDYVDANMLNNAATRAIIVGNLPSNHGVIQGWVIDVTGGWSGVGSVTLELYEDGSTEPLYTTETDSTGHFLFEAPAGEYRVTIIPVDGYRAELESIDTQIVAQEIGEVEFHLSNINGIIQGQVIDVTNEGIGVDNVTISLYKVGSIEPSAITETDSTGHFLFEAPAGEYRVMIIPPVGFQAEPESIDTQIVAQEVSEVEFYLSEEPSPDSYWLRCLRDYLNRIREIISNFFSNITSN